MTEEREVRLRPSRPKRQPKDESKTWSKAFKGVMQIVRMSSRLGASERGSGVLPFAIGGAAHKSGMRQRCAVRVTYSANRVRGQWGAHGRYLMRESASLPTCAEGAGFSSDAHGVNIAKTLDGWQKAGDLRLFKLIVSPEFAGRIDLEKHTRALMARIADDLRMPIEWMAIAHFNTEHPHVHIVLRGVANGQPLRLERDYIKRGIRQHAEALCTAQLGFRTQADAMEAERRESGQLRITSLDRVITHAWATAEDSSKMRVRVNPDSGRSEYQRVRDQNLFARLRFLEQLELAAYEGPGTWLVRSDFEAALRALQRVTDRQKLLAAHSALLSDPRLALKHTSLHEPTTLEGRVIAHTLDEASGVAHMILEGTDATVHLIAHSDATESARNRGRLRPNNFVRISVRMQQGRKQVHIRDFGDAEAYLMSNHICAGANCRPSSLNGLEQQWGGWLGRYYLARAAAQRANFNRQRS